MVSDISLEEGSLIDLPLTDGTRIGKDYDKRLRPLNEWMAKCGLIETKDILDLGSNSGHFPAQYVRAGASTVTAVEPRQRFLDQWERIKGLIEGSEGKAFEHHRINWVCADVRRFQPQKTYDVVSCLGLVYHVEGMFDALEWILRKAKPKVVLIESQVWGDAGRVQENHAKGTEAFVEGEMVFRDTIDWTESRIERLFGCPADRIWAVPNDRGFWVVRRKHVFCDS